ncbi:hypothetical protein AK812_SmicGene20024 [Symbiodinium microadriaticum]|uniref:Uncharacterized protein n=1 Tax=Symbiodinium microadriaticum TaxID=2951 RepID=A0A1Q9DR50_SYMMI|nr:hypothetical protein AK812_SmicGene20024 [Symbiodinium microadriaticum]
MGWRPVRKQGCRKSKGLLIRMVSPASRAEGQPDLAENLPWSEEADLERPIKRGVLGLTDQVQRPRAISCRFPRDCGRISSAVLPSTRHLDGHRASGAAAPMRNIRLNNIYKLIAEVTAQV